MPAAKSTTSKPQSFHHSQATLPGLIHEVSARRHSSAKFHTKRLSANSLSSVAMTTPRQGNVRLPVHSAIYGLRDFTTPCNIL